MPVVVNSQAWEIAFRVQVRKLASGWNVGQFRGRVRLKVRPVDSVEQSVVLPFTWSVDNTGDAYVRIRNIYKLVSEGHSLRVAAEIAEGKISLTLSATSAGVKVLGMAKAVVLQ